MRVTVVLTKNQSKYSKETQDYKYLWLITFISRLNALDYTKLKG